MQKEKLLFSNCAMVDGELFFIEIQHGLPAKMNLNSGTVSYCGVIENYILQEGDSLHDIRAFDGRIYALEISGKSVIIFDLEKLQCQYITLNCAYRPWGNFVAFEQYGSYFYIFPKYENKICIMNTHNNEITEVIDYFDGVEELQCGCRVGDKVWLIPSNVDIIGCYDLPNGEMKIYELEKKIEEVIYAIPVDRSIYILNRFGIIYIWDIDNRKLNVVKILETEHVYQESVCRMVYAGNKLIILPGLAENIKILNLATGMMEIYHDYPKDFFYYGIEGWSKYLGLCEDDNYYYGAMRRENYLLKISKQDGALSWIKPDVPSKKVRMTIEHTFKRNRCKADFVLGKRLFTERDVGVENFLEEVQKEKYITERANTGKEIFATLKRSGD